MKGAAAKNSEGAGFLHRRILGAGRISGAPLLRTSLLLVAFAFGMLSPACVTVGSAATPAVLAASNSSGKANPASSVAEEHAGNREKSAPHETEDIPVGQYLRSPMVQKLANRFRMPVDTASRTFEIINFIFIVAGIIWLIARFFPKMLRARSERLRSELQRARTSIDNANRRLAAVEERLSRLDSEIDAVRRQAEEETRIEEQRLRAAMEREKQAVTEAAAQDIHAARKNAENQLRKLAVDLTIENASRQIAVTPEVDRALVSGFLAELNGDASRQMVGSGARGAGAADA
jgi:F-type H+-transporting ATPase subunit b